MTYRDTLDEFGGIIAVKQSVHRRASFTLVEDVGPPMVTADDDYSTTLAKYDWLWQVRTGFLCFVDRYCTLSRIRVVQSEPARVGDCNELFLFVDRSRTPETLIRNYWKLRV